MLSKISTLAVFLIAASNLESSPIFETNTSGTINVDQWAKEKLGELVQHSTILNKTAERQIRQCGYSSSQQPGSCQLQPATFSHQVQPSPISTKVQPPSVSYQVQPPPIACLIQSRMALNAYSSGQPTGQATAGQPSCQVSAGGQPTICGITYGQPSCYCKPSTGGLQQQSCGYQQQTSSSQQISSGYSPPSVSYQQTYSCPCQRYRAKRYLRTMLQLLLPAVKNL